MGQADVVSVRDALRAEATRALKARDQLALRTYRTTLAEIDNAEAVPVETLPRAGAIEAAAVGLGAAEGSRRELSEADMRRIVRDEVAQLRSAAVELGAGAADDVMLSADLLESVLAALDRNE